MTTYSFHSDAGHGWLKVSIDELKRLKLMDKISPYSYRKGNYAYLEEDSDASQFINLKKALKEKFKYNEVDDGGSSPIRNYPAFDTLMGYKPDKTRITYLKGKSGWKGESVRHGMSARGLPSGKKKSVTTKVEGYIHPRAEQFFKQMKKGVCLGCGGTGYVTKMPENKKKICRLCKGTGY